MAATAGAGKTTAVVQACQSGDIPVAWLTLDRADSAPGRLLLYIEAAIAEHVESVRGLVQGVLAARITHDEAAGLLVDATNDFPLILVIDGLEHLSESPGGLSVVEALVRYAPRSLKIVLLSRSDIAIDSRMISGVDLVAAIGELDLAFTLEETEIVLKKRNWMMSTRSTRWKLRTAGSPAFCLNRGAHAKMSLVSAENPTLSTATCLRKSSRD